MAGWKIIHSMIFPGKPRHFETLIFQPRLMTVLGQESAKPDNAMAGFGQRPQSMTMTFMTASRIRWWTTRLPAACFEMFWSFKTLIIPKLSKIWQYLIAMIVIIDIITIYIIIYTYYNGECLTCTRENQLVWARGFPTHPCTRSYSSLQLNLRYFSPKFSIHSTLLLLDPTWSGCSACVCKWCYWHPPPLCV